MNEETKRPRHEGVDEAELRRQLEILEKKQDIVTNKQARGEVRYKIAQIKWRLGLISDKEFAEAEEFYETFTFDWS